MVFNKTLGLGTAVFTTKYVLDQRSPIVNVYHFDDGSWQFSGKETDLNDEDYKVISFGEILAIDETLKELADIPPGFEAVRKNKEGIWKIISGN